MRSVLSISRRDARQAGFTVLEVLVCVMILALILSFLPGTLRVGQRVWETDDAFARRAGLSAFCRHVEQRLTEAMPIYRRTQAGTLRMEFDGAPDRLSFVAPANAGPGGGGVYHFTLSLNDGGGASNALALTQTLYRPRDAFAPANTLDSRPASSRHLAPEPVRSLAFRYFGAALPGREPGWHAQWPREDALPDLVEMTVTTASRVEPARFVVPLRLGSALSYR